jgi:hypothetical protein
MLGLETNKELEIKIWCLFLRRLSFQISFCLRGRRWCMLAGR